MELILDVKMIKKKNDITIISFLSIRFSREKIEALLKKSIKKEKEKRKN